LFKFHTYLFDNLLTLRHIRLGIFTGQALPRTADCETLVIEQAPDLTNDQDILALIVATVAPTFHRLELRKLLLPISEYVRFDRTQVAHFTNREVALTRYWR